MCRLDDLTCMDNSRGLLWQNDLKISEDASWMSELVFESQAPKLQLCTLDDLTCKHSPRILLV